MSEPVLRIIFCESKFYALENCDAIEFADHFDDYMMHMAHVLEEKYNCVCFVESCLDSEYAVQFVEGGGNRCHSLVKRVYEDYASDYTGVVDFNDFIEKVEAV